MATGTAGHGPARELIEEGRVEAMGHISPDGRPPHRKELAKASAALPLAGVLIFLGLIAVVLLGGPSALGMALVYLGITLLAAFPVWLSALYRQKEERQATYEGRVIVREWKSSEEGTRR